VQSHVVMYESAADFWGKKMIQSYTSICSMKIFALYAVIMCFLFFGVKNYCTGEELDVVSIVVCYTRIAMVSWSECYSIWSRSSRRPARTDQLGARLGKFYGFAAENDARGVTSFSIIFFSKLILFVVLRQTKQCWCASLDRFWRLYNYCYWIHNLSY